MKVAYVCADRGVPFFGMKGCSLHVQEVVRVLDRLGMDVELFSPALDGEPPCDLARLRLHRLERATPPGRMEREQADYRAARMDIGQLERCGPFDLVYERYSLWGHAAMRYARITGIPGILEVNAPLIDEQARHRGLIDRSLAERVARSSFAAASLLVAVSDGVASWLESFPEARGKIHVVPNGVNTERFAPRIATPDTGEGEFTIGFVGTLKPWHGLDDLMTAFTDLHATHPRARLLVVGDGPEAGTLRAWRERAGLAAAVELTGAVSPGRIPELLGRMHVGVAPYGDDPAFYFSPLKVYEYMAAGLAVVASRIGQLDGLVEDRVNGLLYTPGDTAELTRILSWLYHEPAHVPALGSAARETVERAHGWRKRVDTILCLAAGMVGQTLPFPAAV